MANNFEKHDLLSSNYIKLNTQNTPIQLFNDYLILYVMIKNNLNIPAFQFTININNTFCNFDIYQKTNFINLYVKFMSIYTDDQVTTLLKVINETNTRSTCTGYSADNKPQTNQYKVISLISKKLLERLGITGKSNSKKNQENEIDEIDKILYKPDPILLQSNLKLLSTELNLNFIQDNSRNTSNRSNDLNNSNGSRNGSNDDKINNIIENFKTQFIDNLQKNTYPFNKTSLKSYFAKYPSNSSAMNSRLSSDNSPTSFNSNQSSLSSVNSSAPSSTSSPSTSSPSTSSPSSTLSSSSASTLSPSSPSTSSPSSSSSTSSTSSALSPSSPSSASSALSPSSPSSASSALSLSSTSASSTSQQNINTFATLNTITNFQTFRYKFNKTKINYCNNKEFTSATLSGSDKTDIKRTYYNYKDKTKNYILINLDEISNLTTKNKEVGCSDKTLITFVIKDNKLKKVYYYGTQYMIKPYSDEGDKKNIAAINAIIQEIENYTPTAGGAKKNNKKKTKDTIVYKGKSRCVYTGPRGGKYIKYNNKYISCKNV